MTLWKDTLLCQAMQSLDLRRRLISFGLDGSLSLSSASQSPCGASPNGGDDELYFMRSIAWRIYLKILPLPFTGTSLENLTATWCTKLYTNRALYATQKQTFHECYPAFAEIDTLDRDGSDGDTAPEEVVTIPKGSDEKAALRGSACLNSLSKLRQRRSSAANARKATIGKGISPLERCNPEVKEDIITLDIRRTFLNNDPEVPHIALFHMLSVWRWLHPVVGYHQGMHEIAGYCLQVLSRAAFGVPSECPAEISECANAAFREADAFYLFDAIMTVFGLSELFHVSTVVGQSSLSQPVGTAVRFDLAQPAHQRLSTNLAVAFQSPNSRNLPVEATGGGGSTPKGANFMMPVEAHVSDIPERPELSMLESVCEHIAFHMLRDHSSTLYHHLANTAMFDQLLVFLPRWVRNLFTRELATPQLMVVWDGLFAIFFHEDSERISRKIETYHRGGGGDGEESPRGLPTSFVYAGSKEASAISAGGFPRAVEQYAAPFSRTVLGMAVAILLHLEEDLVLLEDDFSMLRRLTATPILSPLVDPHWLMNSAMAIAGSRPPGIIPHHRNKRQPLKDNDDDTQRSLPKSMAAAAATRLTKEEMMLQQRSVALVVDNVVRRLAEVLHIDPLATSTSVVGTSKSLEGGTRLNAEELSIAKGALRELQCVVDRLSFV